MKPYAYYNDIDPFVCEWLRNLIKDGLIMDGEVDERSIVDVQADDLRGFTRQHFFAGIGGWDRALQLAKWPEERPVTTASLPCQPFSVAGKQLGKKDERHLWPEFERLVDECRFRTICGEQVTGAIKLGWIDGIHDALAAKGYAFWFTVLPACSVGAPHLRQRLWWVADSLKPGLEGHSRDGNNRSEPGRNNQEPDGSASEGSEHGRMGNTESNHQQRNRKPRESERQDGEDRGSGLYDSRLGITNSSGSQPGSETTEAVGYGDSFEPASFWSKAIYWPCSDGKHRRIPAPEPGFQSVVDGVRDRMGDLWDDGIAQALTGFPLSGKVPNRVGLLKGAGNSIVSQVAAVFIKAFMEGKNEK